MPRRFNHNWPWSLRFQDIRHKTGLARAGAALTDFLGCYSRRRLLWEVIMKRLISALAVAAAAACLGNASAALAETLVTNDQVQLRDSNVDRPSRGATMAAVEAKYGAPTQRHAAVGGASSAQPVITRWDYPHFSVFFEKDRVIHAVATGS